MKLSDYIANFISQYVDTIFCGNGGCILHLLHSLNKKVKCVPLQCETAAGQVAESYARNKDFAVCVTTSSPGIIYSLQGMACAYFDSIPVLFICGASPTSQLKKDKNVRQLGFQEIDTVKLTKPISKYSVLLTDPKMIRYELEKCIYMAQEGRKGSVVLEIPDDLQRAEINPDELEGYKIENKACIDYYKSHFHEIEESINQSKRPLIIVGNGVKLSKLINKIDSFIAKTKIPVLTTWATIDMFPENYPYLIGNFGVSANRYGNFAVSKADLLIVFGSRLDTHMTGANVNNFAKNAKKIIIDVDYQELKRFDNDNNAYCILSDLKLFLNEWYNHTDFNITQDFSEWHNELIKLKEKYPVVLPEYEKQNTINPYHFMDFLSKTVNNDAIVITDAGMTLTVTMQAFKILAQQKLYSAFNNSPMGYALPASIGAYFACPDKQIICITGDGGMSMNIQELATIKHYNIPVKIFVINNRGYGIIRQTYDTWLNSEYVACDENTGLAQPDFVEIAKAYGIAAFNIEKIKKRFFEVTMESNAPILYNIEIDPREKIIPKLEFGRELYDLSPLLSREEIEEVMKI